jgi:hypothetical protein
VIASSNLIGKGIYPVPDAARLSKVTPRRIRYWIEGRDSESRAAVRSPGLWAGEHEPIDNKIVLGFLDLQEVRFVDAFLNRVCHGHSLDVLMKLRRIGIRQTIPFAPFNL